MNDEETNTAKPARQARAGNDLAARIKAQQETPTNPVSATQSTAPIVQSAPQPPPTPPQPTQAERRGKSTVRATHFVDERQIEWVRTGITLPNAYQKGIIAYVNAKRLEWNIGDPKVTQQDIEVEAIGVWLNDHRSEIPANVNAMCDEVRAKLRHS